VPVRRREHRAHALQELGRCVVAPALGAKHLLQPALELGVVVARGAAPQVSLDLDVLHPDQLTVEVELDLAKHVLALSP
jgi:hypothetical protein